jgi:hypothetical protein
MPEIEHRAGDVFGIPRDLPLNYVSRKAVDNRFIESLTQDKHLVIYGSSKQGKTCLRKHCLEESDYITVHCSNKWSLAELHSNILKRAGYDIALSSKQTVGGRKKVKATFGAKLFGVGIGTEGEKESNQSGETTTAELELDVEDVNDVIASLKKIKFDKFIVLEDFHYLPTLVGTSLWSFQDLGAAFMPRRGFFGTPSEQPLNDVDVQGLLKLMARYTSGVNIRGFGIAIRRFRDAHERYWPGDPEALLDICIALEALFLGDQDTKELRHRLLLRVARLLSRQRTIRQELSKNIKYLYDLRSRIAHGDTAETMKSGDARKLERVMTQAPLILRMTLLAFLNSAGPEGIPSNDKLAGWWSEIELG